MSTVTVKIKITIFSKTAPYKKFHWVFIVRYDKYQSLEGKEKNMSGPIEPEKIEEKQEPEKEESEQPKEKKAEGDGKRFHERIAGRFEEIKKSEHFNKALNFTRTNTLDTFAYIALFIGIILLFFVNFWGGLIIGAVGGFYFADTFIHWLRNFEVYLEKEGMVKVLILLGVALGFLIVAPTFFLGGAAAVGIKFLLFGES